RLFLANYATSTELKVSFLTSTVPLTCFTALSNAACVGRSARFKRVKHAGMRQLDEGTKSIGAEVASSINTEPEYSDTPITHELASDFPERGDEEELKKGTGRKFFTVWNVAYSTTTMTTTYTNTGLTVPISAMCVPSGYPVLPIC
ncbi:hypothetical protein FHG87_025319, partial [Trinorchestia longiramus]